MRSDQAVLGRIDRMDGRVFREYIANLLRHLGYTVTTTSYLGDYATGLVVSRNGKRFLIQAKHSQQQVRKGLESPVPPRRSRPPDAASGGR